MRAALLVLAVLANPSPASADAMCGITARICRSAETKTQSRYKPVNQYEWYTLQDWSPWSVSIDPGTRTIDLRFRFGGHADNRGGVGYRDPEEQTLHHEVRSCTGSVASGKVELDVGGEAPVRLLFENGVLVRVIDPQARARAGYGVHMVARETLQDEPTQELEWLARNVTPACPGGGQSATGSAPTGGTTSTAKKAAAPAPTTSAPAADGDRYESAKSTPGPQQRQQTTGEQGGAGGAKLVDFGGERFRMTDKTITHLESGIEIMRTLGPPTTYAEAATACPRGWHLFDSKVKSGFGYESNVIGYLKAEEVFPGLDFDHPVWVGTAGHPEMKAKTMAMRPASFDASVPADQRLSPLCSRWGR